MTVSDSPVVLEVPMAKISLRSQATNSSFSTCRRKWMNIRRVGYLNEKAAYITQAKSLTIFFSTDVLANIWILVQIYPNDMDKFHKHICTTEITLQALIEAPKPLLLQTFFQCFKQKEGCISPSSKRGIRLITSSTLKGGFNREDVGLRLRTP